MSHEALQGDRHEPATPPSPAHPRRLRPLQPVPSVRAPQFDFSGLRKDAPQDAVFQYVEQGLWVVSVERRTGEVGKATKDPERAVGWAENPALSVRVATGHDRYVVAVRCKGEKGRRTLRVLLSGQGDLATPECLSEGHAVFLFRAPADALPSRQEVAPGLDFLGEGGHFEPVPSSWCQDSRQLATLPDCIRAIVEGTATFGRTELFAAGDFSALEGATPYEAAQAYAARGWQLADNYGTHASPELWRDEPTAQMSLATGSVSGTVGLWFRGYPSLRELEARHGALPLPRYVGSGVVHLFRAPEEKFLSKVLPENVEYFGEGDSLLVPPQTTSTGERLRWQLGNELVPELPELPQWLHAVLSGRQEAEAVVPATPATKKGKGSTRLWDAAKRYAEQGWLVLPVWPNAKNPMPKNGFKAATRNQDQIAKWWKGKGNNIAVRTGSESGVVVLDVDVKNGQPGLQSLAALEEQHGRLDTLQARTPSGGLHFFFRAPRQILPSPVGFLPGLDFRAQNAFIVLAPSSVGGNEYRWENNAPMAELPDWLLSLLSAPAAKRAKGATTAKAAEARQTYTEALRGVQEGSRNDTVFRLACRLRLDGWHYDEALALVRTAAGNCDPPLSEEEATRCLDGAWRYSGPQALSDLGNAERFVARCGDSVRYVQETGRWLVWAGHWWETNRRALFRMAKGTVRSLRDEADAEADPNRRRLLLQHGRKSETAEAIGRMLELAAPELSVRAENLDRDGIVAFANGVLDTAAGTLRPGRREDLLTKHAPFHYDPTDPRCRQWLERPGSLPGKKANAVATSWQERLDRWLAERCQLGQGLSAQSGVLREDFVDWAGEAVEPQLFGRLLRARGFERRKSNDTFYVGLCLRGDVR